ncbi:hypothetical protein WSM22_23180 [Cytophagales bacterium WSM2-2]|nr:hypothetical protein WSM22_23180 [Cytophagales bacterium WSM2-2]
MLDGAKKLEAILDKSHSVDLTSFYELAQRKGLLNIKKNTYSLNKLLVSDYIDFLEGSNISFAQVIRSRPIIVNNLFNGKMHPYNPQNYAFLGRFLESRSDITLKHELSTVVCCNKFCEKFDQAIENKHLIRVYVNNKTEPGAKVKCPNCGMNFLVSLKLNSAHKLVIKDHGQLVQNMIRAKVRKGFSFRKLEMEFGIRRRTIAKICNRKVRNEKNEHAKFIKLRDERRKRWKNELNSPGFFSIKKSAKIMKTEYRWLLKKDSKWMLHINAKFSRRFRGRHKTSSPNTREFKSKLRDIKQYLVSLQIPRKISVMLIASHLTKRERTQIAMHATIKLYIKSLAESYQEFNSRRSSLLKAA